MYIGIYKLYMQIHISMHLSSFCSLVKVDALVTQCLQQLDAIFSALGEVHTAGTIWYPNMGHGWKKLRQAFNCWRWGWEKRRNVDRMWFMLNIWQIMWWFYMVSLDFSKLSQFQVRLACRTCLVIGNPCMTGYVKISLKKGGTWCFRPTHLG